MPLRDVRAHIAEQRADGLACPACDQYVREYKRKINAGMAHALVEMYKHAGTEWFFLPNITSRWRGRDEAMLRYWGLIEETTEPRADGGKAGWWRVTEKGRAFVREGLRVPTYAHVYNNECLGYSGDPRSLRACLGSRFSLRDLLAE